MRAASFAFGLSLALIILLSSVWADTVVASAAVVDHITIIDKAYFTLNVTNTDIIEHQYIISSSDLAWAIEPKDKVKKITLMPGESYLTELEVYPVKELSPGIYLVPVYIGGDANEEVQLKVYLGSLTQPGYAPTVKVTVDMPAKVDPSASVSIKILLQNLNALNLTGVKVKLSSEELPEFAQSAVVDIPSLGTKEVEFSITPNPHQQPKEYTLKVALERFGEDFKVVEQDIEVVTLLPPFSVSKVEEKWSYLKLFQVFEVKNGGNVLNQQEVRVPVSWLQAWLETGNAEVKTEQGQRFFTWGVTLGPNSSTAVYSAIDYRIIVYIVIVLALLIWFYIYTSCPLAVKKHAIVTKKDDEGALSEIKITIEVKNKSGKQVKDVTVVDIVPAYAVYHKGGVEAEEMDASVRPQRVTHGKEGAQVIWSLSDLDAKEQRVMSYHLKAKLNILGAISLPRATAEYMKKGGKKRKAYSNIFKLE
ncbi:hypothetical protein HZC30_01130 [Candidatus Woesearchaeota archaeon]|nr:hypothetical protein [Candidatus Woesearchaeota archaeon]